MASVEQILQRLRRGDAPEIPVAAVGDRELAEGVERIRRRLADKSISVMNDSHAFRARIRIRRYWVPALTAALVLGIVFWPRGTPVQVTHVQKPGLIQRYGSVEFRIIKDTILQSNYVGNALVIDLKQGILAVKRDNPSTFLEVRTPAGKLVAMGTTFIIEHAKITSLRLIEGNLKWYDERGEKTINANNPTIGRDLTMETLNLPEEFHILRKVNKTNHMSEQATFKYGDCVTYYRNNEKRRGKIYAHDDGGYIIHGNYGPEPGYFREGDIFRRNCAEQ